jgi:STE24 endopeptidase
VRSAVVSTLALGGVPFQNVVVENLSRSTVRADAYFAGEGPTRLIVIGDTMLSRYSPREIAVVVAHEMGHLRESVWLSRLASALGLLLGVLLLDRLLRFCARRGWFGLRTPADVTGYLLILFAFEMLNWFGGPLSAWRSRARESAADAYALTLTGDPQSFVTMMARLTAQNRADPVPAGWLEELRWGHPASARRIAMALRFARAHAIALQLPPAQDAVVSAAASRHQ